MPKPTTLGVDARAARLGTFEFFEDERATAVTHDEAIAILVPGTAGTLRIVIALRQRPRLAEAGQGGRRRGALGTTRDDDVRIAVLDAAHAEADGMRGGGAGADHAEVRAAQAEADADRCPATMLPMVLGM